MAMHQLETRTGDPVIKSWHGLSCWETGGIPFRTLVLADELNHQQARNQAQNNETNPTRSL